MSNDMTQDFAQKLLLEQALIGRVVTQATAIEHIIDAYIATFYTRCPAADYQEPYLAFMYDIMNDRGVGLDTKIGILSKVSARLTGHKLNRTLFTNWLAIRNKFAHGTYIADKGILYGGEFYDVNELADQHATLQIKVNAELEKLSELCGPYFNLIAMKEEGAK